ncbi:TPA: hypothetical protein ACTC2X_001592, partial [Neisseria meningitidis]
IPIPDRQIKKYSVKCRAEPCFGTPLAGKKANRSKKNHGQIHYGFTFAADAANFQSNLNIFKQESSK